MNGFMDNARVLWRCWRQKHAKPPVPGESANPPAPPAPGCPARESHPVAPTPGLPRRPPSSCPDGCGAPLSYTIRVWECDQVRLYGPHGHLAGRTRCLDGELRRLFHDVAFEQRQAGDHPDGF